MAKEFEYLIGFGNELVSEAEKGAVPEGRNSPQKAPFGLYPEQLTGSAFTAPRGENKRTWCYKLRPSVVYHDFKRIKFNDKILGSGESSEAKLTPNQLRWGPYLPENKTSDLWESLKTIVVTGSPESQSGGAVHLWATQKENLERFFYNADAEMVFVPWSGKIILKTELGSMHLTPGEIGVVPRGVKMQALLKDKESCGYLMENYGRPFRLPDLGPIGANGLANPRDFEIPVANYENKKAKFEIVQKFGGSFFSCETNYSPLDVVGWHGNYLPYKYDLYKFNTIGTISYDHPDPSIFTVLTSPSERPGTANMDFVIFPPRWLVGEDTFRPPYYHRNCMSEYMGLIEGKYDAKEEGFVPGGSSLHNAMIGHGPDKQAFEKASEAKLKPEKVEKTMAFMFETRWLWKPSSWALDSKLLHKNYAACWSDLKLNFKI